MKKYDYLVVGSGLYGAVFAHEAKARGKSVLVVDKRPNIAGNVYTEKQEGINVHMYGAHIFHTNNKKVWNYITQFAEFNRFTNSPVANYKGELYSMPFNMYTFNKMWGVVTPEEAAAKIEEQKKEIIGEPQNLEEQAISLVGRDIYEKLVKGYTEKQWGRDCKELPAFIIKRLPVRLTFDKVYKLPKYILYSMICICVDVFVTYVLYNVIKSRIILFVMAIILVGIILYAIWHYISISHTLRRVINFSDEERFDANFVEAWNLTYDLKTSVMTKKQLDKYNRYRIFLRAKLGCFHANEQELQIYENGDRCQKAFYHFIRFIQYLAMGEVQKAYDNIKEAEALSNGDIDKVLRSQILINRGVAYVQLGMYQDADDAFIRAISYCQKHNIKS